MTNLLECYSKHVCPLYQIQLATSGEFGVVALIQIQCYAPATWMVPKTFAMYPLDLYELPYLLFSEVKL